MRLDISTIKLSKNDLRFGVRIPTTLTEELAEFMGIMMGDGHLGYYRGILGNGKAYVNYQIKIAGNRAEETYLKYVMFLFCSLFNLNLKYTQDTAPNSISESVLPFLSSKKNL